MLDRVQGQAEGVLFLRKVVAGHLRSPLLLVGPEGVGKRFSVIEAAKEAFSKLSSSEFHLAQIERGIHPDVHVIRSSDGEKDIGVSAIRDLVEMAASFPSSAPVRYVILDGADRLTDAAGNALLKTLEEPHETTRFFLLAENAQNVIPTIRSRCGELRYRPLPEAFVLQFLKQYTDDDKKALVYSRISEGSVGRALQFLGSARLGLRDEMLGLLKLGLGGDLSSLFSSVGKVSDLVLGLQFLEHVLLDLLMLPIDPEHITNADIAPELNLLRGRIGTPRVWKLMDSVIELRRLPSSVNLSYQVKSRLATAFE